MKYVKKFVRVSAWVILLPFVLIGFFAAVVAGAIGFGFNVTPDVLDSATDWMNDE